MYPRLPASPKLMPADIPPEARTPDTLLLHPPAPPQALEPQVLAAPEVRFEPPPGEPARASLSVELSCHAPGAVIRYALDADDVDANAPVYDAGEKILLTQSASISARAWLGDAAGPLAQARYEIVKATWQQREPEDQSDPTPHQEARDFAFHDGWQASAASERGKLHAHRGLWREDAFDMAQAASPAGTWAILIVADGAGSAPLARVGSRLACRAAADSLRAGLSEQELNEDAEILKERDLPLLRGRLVQAARSALQVLGSEGQARQRPLGDFATTLLILVRCAWEGQQVCGALQVGDGAIALLNHDGLLTILGQADHGEHSSETRFLTTPGIEAELASRTRFSIRSGLSAVSVMSDGVSDDFFPEEQRLPMMLAQLLPLVQANSDDGSTLLGWIGYEKKGSSDDRTLLVSWNANAQAASTCEESQHEAQQAAWVEAPEPSPSLEPEQPGPEESAAEAPASTCGAESGEAGEGEGGCEGGCECDC